MEANPMLLISEIVLKLQQLQETSDSSVYIEQYRNINLDLDSNI